MQNIIMKLSGKAAAAIAALFAGWGLTVGADFELTVAAGIAAIVGVIVGGVIDWLLRQLPIEL